MTSDPTKNATKDFGSTCINSESGVESLRAPMDKPDAKARDCNDTFAVWDELKRVATAFAATSEPLPDADACEVMVLSIVRKCGWESLHALACAFYAAELADLITSIRTKNASLTE